VVERRTRITRLGDGLEASGRLAPAAIERVVSMLRTYRELLDQHHVEELRITATSAARDASNREEFFNAVQAVVGIRPELLSGDDEAKLTFRGATAELDATQGPFLVVDIGGGSTEFAFGSTRCEAAISLDIGSVRLTETYIESDPPLPEELLAVLSITEAHLDDVARLHPMMGSASTLVGVAGTVTAAAAVEQGLANYDRAAIHHFVLSKAAVEDVYRTLVTEARSDRIHNPGLEPDRAEMIVGGLCILVKVMRYFGFEECLVSESDILDGLVMSQVAANAEGSVVVP
jgi:exopolyphosphatase/guanosine-5'-triphosphate,3'-diphosphate pyrophosphatase